MTNHNKKGRHEAAQRRYIRKHAIPKAICQGCGIIFDRLQPWFVLCPRCHRESMAQLHIEEAVRLLKKARGGL